MNGRIGHEEALIRAFILPQRQSRYLELLPKPKRRRDVTRELAHFKHVDMRFAVPIPPSQSGYAGILALLKSKGAPDTCYAVSEDDELDGKELPLSDSLKKIVGYGMGTFLSCLPGRLAYFEDEDERWILERKGNC
jgi:hypothetical protein